MKGYFMVSCPALALQLLFWVMPESAIGQPLTCNANSVPPTMRSKGRAELTGDLVLSCNGGVQGSASFLNFAVYLNTAVTSNLTGPGPHETEALLLIDDPSPSPAVNNCNGFLYVGQVKGTPGVAAGTSGSGNAYTGQTQTAANALSWTGIPLVAPGGGSIRVFRFTNLRANASMIAVSNATVPIQAALNATGLAINNPVLTVAFAQDALNFSSSISGAGVSLQFSEAFSTAFKLRTTPGMKQNIPGFIYNTESGFNPDFATANPGDIGSANTGTRLVAQLSGLPAGVQYVVAPNAPTSGSLQLRRIKPPYGPSLAGGTLAPSTGFGAVGVSGGKAVLLYEVVSASPLSVESITIPAMAWPNQPLAGVTVFGGLAPIDPANGVSGPAPEPRFAP